MIAQGSEFNALIADVKNIKRKIDEMLASYRATEKEREKARKVEQPVIKETAPAPAPVKEKEPPKQVVKEKPVVAVQPEKPVEQPKKNVPSYVRGVVVPPPKPVPPVREPRKNAQGGPRQQGGRKPDGKPTTQQPRLQKPGGMKIPPVKMELPVVKERNKSFDNKRKDHKPEDKKTMNKRTLIRKGFIQDDVGEERMGTRKLKNKKPKTVQTFTPIKIEKAVITTENLTVKILSEKIGKTAQEIIKQLMVLGIMTNINSVVDFQTMELVANELGVELELKLDKTMEAQLEEAHEEADKEEDLVKRPPVITVMGHVDHGKTSLLDAIRKTSVAAGEAGGITQHIGAYSVVCKGEKITFLDTPGHEAFTEMRARGAKVTDIAILIVAADDGVMPQTIEAINHAKAADVPVIVAINKIDKPGANIDRIKQQLTEYGLVTEEWGGDTIMVPISAKQGQGIDKLLEMILFVAEYNNYRANPNRNAKGSIVEAKLDKGKGPIANVIVQNGTLKVGDFVVSGMTFGRVRAMTDDKGRNIKEAGPSMPVSVLGFNEVPSAGDAIYVVNDEKTARQVIEERNTKLKNEQANQGQKVTFDDMMNKFNEGQLKEFNLIVKADVQGSVEALKASLLKLEGEDVKVRVIHSGVGAINKSDLMLANISNAIVIGFNVRPDNESRALAEQNGVDVRLYRVIYEALEDMERTIKGLAEPKYQEVNIGRAQVRNVFKITGVGMVAGSYVLSGKMQRNAKVRVFRGSEMIHDGVIETLKRFKDDVKEVGVGYECGICIAGFNDIKENDELEAYILEEIKA
ncbi:MAG: translation initiation factor IF-2 [Clostridiales bacterium]|nr:translation initiation factor IF-2 [Clostridiales bacterium]